jgi:hypothetical protein
VTLQRDDSLVPALTPPDRAWRVLGPDGVFRGGVVAGSGRAWSAGRVMPSRTRPIAPVGGVVTSRRAAVELLR